MARFQTEAPEELIAELDRLGSSAETVFGEMTMEAAKAVYQKVRSNTEATFEDPEGMLNCLKVTRTYKTVSDGGINNKVGFYGYFANRYGKTTPAPLVANAKEFGTSRMKKKPFFRKCFVKSDIEKIMEEVQEKYLPKE